MRRLIGFASGLLILVSTLSAVAQPVFEPEDLGAPPGETSLTPWLINRNGQVTGTSGQQVFFWTRSQNIQYLEGLSGMGFLLLGGINDNGQVVGTDYFSPPFGAHAFSWTPAGGLVKFGLGGSYSAVAAVNNSGQVAGQSFIPDNTAGHAFLWTPGANIRDLGTLPGGFNSDADALNSSGDVVGWSDVFIPQAFTNRTHAFLWSPATQVMHDLGTLAGPLGTSFATAVNDNGQVVGHSTIQGDDRNVHAFMWAAGRMHDLGTLGGTSSAATAVNNSGAVVGWSTNTRRETRAFVWTEGGVMVDLGTLGGSYALAHAINANGQIIGESLTTDAGVQAFVWTATDGMVRLAPLSGFTHSTAMHQTDGDEIFGFSTNGSSWRATVWRRRVASPTHLAVSGTATYGQAATLSATLTAAESNVAAQSVAFSLNGNQLGSATTDVNGVATLTGIGVAGLNAGSYPGAVTATFAGADGYLASSAQGALTVRKANQTITFAGAPPAKTVGTSFLVTAGASSGLPVVVTAAGACSISGMTVTMTAPTGVCSLTADQAGDANYNAAPQATQTTVANYDFRGFFAPIDNPPAMNRVTAGASVPVKFSLTGNQTLAILDGTPASTPIGCDSSAPPVEVEMIATGSSGLSYDASTDQYKYVWKTDNAWADTCRQLVLKLVDGTLHRANFTFKK